jgi:hypothetical protein
MKESKYPKSTFSCLYNGTIILKIAKWTVGKKNSIFLVSRARTFRASPIFQ